MNQLHIWQLAVDIAFVVTLLFVSARWIKRGSSADLLPKTIELEGSLRALLAEADNSSRSLTDQLRERQSSLDRTLREIRDAEERLKDLPRVEGVISKGESIAKEIEGLLKGVRGELSSAEVPKRQAKRNIEKDLERVEVVEAQERPTPIIEPKEPSKRTISDMQRVYAHAEQLLKEGRGLRHVTQETELPEEEVRLLSQMIEVEREEEKSREPQRPMLDRDSRLGVLASMKRGVQTL